MNKIVFLLFLSLNSIISFSQDTTIIYFNQNWHRTNGRPAYYYGKVFKIEKKIWGVRDYTMADKMLMIGEYKNKKLTKKNGKFTYYFLNGKIKSTGVYLNNKKNGEWVWYFDNGNIDSKGNFINDKRNGDWIWYYDNENIKSKGNFINEKFNGKWVLNFKNGNTDTEAEYMNGKLEGIRSLYFESGPLCAKESYKDGNKTDCQYWNKEGKEINKEEAVFLLEFPGGSKAQAAYVKQHTVYPLLASARRIEGEVIIKYKLDDDGNVWDVSVEKPVYTLLDNEAIRVLKSMPRFKPGNNLKRTDEEYYHFKLNFKLLEFRTRK